MEKLTLGGGCFWCLEAVFQRINGVVSVESGYAGGEVGNPSYEEVCTGNTGHAEVIEITFNPEIISLNQLLDVFWAAHDPTTLNRQGADVGTQYRSVLFYRNEKQKQQIEESLLKAQQKFKDKIVTQVVPFETFYKAEGYHQDFYNQNKGNGYCRIVIEPKLRKLFGE
jgi:peptide-methionine (S)-S-oxide reductase